MMHPLSEILVFQKPRDLGQKETSKDSQAQVAGNVLDTIRSVSAHVAPCGLDATATVVTSAILFHPLPVYEIQYGRIWNHLDPSRS